MPLYSAFPVSEQRETDRKAHSREKKVKTTGKKIILLKLLLLQNGLE